MNEYEMMTVFHPRLNADETTVAISTLEEQIVANGGEMLTTDNWGRRRLAYPIDGVVDGTYVLMTFNLPPEGARPLERWIGISESTIRHLLIRGIIPFQGDRGRDRDDRDDRYGRDDRDEDRDEGRVDERRDDERGSAESGEPRAEASAPASAPTEAADAPAEETSSEGSAAPAAEAAAETQPEAESSENESSDNED